MESETGTIIEGPLPPLPPIEKVIQPFELEPTTMDGWEVVESLSFDGPVSYTKQELATVNGYQSYQTITETHVGRQVGFRVRKRADVVLGELSSRVSRLQGQLSESDKKLRDISNDLDRETRAHAATKNIVVAAAAVEAGLRSQLKEAVSSLASLKETNLVLEKELKDFERVKRVFGLRAISEALMKSDAVDVLKEASPEAEGA